MIHFKPFNGWFNNNLPLYYTQDITLIETVQHLICDYNEKLKIIEDSYNSLESTVYETFEKWERLFDEFTTKIENEWAEYKKNMRTEWENYKKNLNNEWTEYKQNMRTEWNNYKNEMNKAFNQLRADMEAYKTEITTSFNELKAEFEALEDNVEAFKADMTGKFTQLRSDWETYQSNLNSEWAQFKEDTTNDLTEYKNNLTGEWAAYKNKMNSNYTEFTQNITAKITAIEGEWDSFEAAQNNKYNEFTTGITEQINAIKSEWAAKQAEINETISNIENEWTAFEGDITTQWTNYKAEVNNIIEEFETEWTGWQETITNITNDNTQIKQDIETLKTTVENLQEQINNIQPSENGIAFIVADENAEIDANTYLFQKSVLQFNNTNTFVNFPTNFSVSSMGYLWNLKGGQVITLINENLSNIINYTRKSGKYWITSQAPIYHIRNKDQSINFLSPYNNNNFGCYTSVLIDLDYINEYVQKEYNANFNGDFKSVSGKSSALTITDQNKNALMLLGASVSTSNGFATVPVLLIYNPDKAQWDWVPSANAVFNSEQFKNVESSIDNINSEITTINNMLSTLNTAINTLTPRVSKTETAGCIANFTPGGTSRVAIGSQDFKTSIKTSKAIGRLSKGELDTTIAMNGGIAIFPGYAGFDGDYNKLYVTAEAFPTDPDIGGAMTFAGSCQPDTTGQFVLTGKVNGSAPLNCDYIIVFTLYDLN